MRKYSLKIIEEWFSDLIEKIRENPIKNIPILVISLIFIYFLGVTLYDSFGLLTLLGYIFASVYGLTKIIDDPRRTVVWAVGFIIGAVAINLFFENFVPMIKGGDMVSLISGLVILYVVVMFYLKSKELESY